MTGKRKGIHLILFFCIFIFISCNPNSSENITDSNAGYVLEELFELPYEVYESSGIITFDSIIWTFNDSGNDPVLFGLDTKTGGVVKTLLVNGAENVDWEDITQDTDFIYIGDFGNNNGTRDDLCIYKVPKSLLNDSAYQETDSEKIRFIYEDQSEFSPGFGNTAYDCEAMIFDGDSLVLFTKDWATGRSSVYKLPRVPGSYKAGKYFELDTDGLITGADFSVQENLLVLCGYADVAPLVIKIKSFRYARSADMEIRRIVLEDDPGIQFEGIAFFGEQILLSSENNLIVQTLYKFIIQ
ncbi:MAG: hypothetical protein PVF73_03575 [Bacteroidales bacterium]|jgi:hypothetical protein